MTHKIGNGSIPLRIGRLIDTTVYGGPYRDVPVDFWGVKMAAEINHPHMVSIPTKDFCVPEVSVLKAGIVKALMAMINEEDVYAGCMGGIGRTGIFLAALAKVQIEYRKTKHRAGRGEDPVLYVRKHFIPHAVETAEQEKYIADLDVSDIVDWLEVTQTAMGLGGLTPARETELVKEHVAKQAEKPAWIPEVDKLDNPAFDHYEAEWKSNRNSRRIDWVDSPEADSAAEEVNLDDDIRFDDLYTRIEELESRLDANTSATTAAFKEQKELGLGIIRALTANPLTKQSIFGKIRSIFS